MTVKVKHLLISFLAVCSTQVVAEEVHASFKDQMVQQTTDFVERTVNLIATPFLSDKDVECLAKNIFYEAGSEPEEGKVAVGLVTLNRAQDPAYPQSVCGVVKQSTALTVPKKTTEVKMVKTGYFSPPQKVVETKTTWTQKIVYQFSWVGQRNIKIKQDDARWIESKRIAEELAAGGYEQYRVKYENAKYFHATYVHPGWKLKKIGRVGNHIFYEPLQPK